KDLDVAEGGQVHVERIVELEVAFLVKHQQCNADDRLGHRVDAEDVVLTHGAATRAVGEAEGLVVVHFAVACDEYHGTGNTPLGEGTLKKSVEALQALAGHVHPFRPGAAEFAGNGRQGGQGEQDAGGAALECAKGQGHGETSVWLDAGP